VSDEIKPTFCLESRADCCLSSFTNPRHTYLVLGLTITPVSVDSPMLQFTEFPNTLS
jgi:hypothetical protein